MTGKLLNPEQIKCQAVCLVRLNERTEWENRPEKDRSQTNGGLVGTISNEASCRFRLGSLLFNEIRAASYEISKNNTINSFGNGSFYICKLVTNVWKKFRPIFFSHALSSSCEHSFSHFSVPFFFLPNKLQEAENFPSFPNKQSRYLLLQNQAHSRSRSSYPMICNKKIKLKNSAGTFYQHARIHGFSKGQQNHCKESKKSTRTMYEIIILPFHRLNYQR